MADRSVSLNGEWKLKAAGRSAGAADISETTVHAEVPGTVHTALMSAGIIPDPFYRDNESKVQWIEDMNWEYSREFELTADDLSFPAIFLTFEGIDTVADVYLNGKRVLHTENMFVTNRVRVERLVHEGGNSLRVLLLSPKKFAVAREKKYGKIFAELDTYRVHIRKAQYSFGWDWGPRLATSGIWRGVHLDFVKRVFIENMHISTVETGKRKVKALFSGRFQPIMPSTLKDLRLRVRVSGDNYFQEFVRPLSRSKTEVLNLPEISQWSTHDFGEPKLYEVDVDVVDKKSVVAAHRNFRTGFRTIRLLREKDKLGESFVFELNGKKIFVKGANWIPADSFLPRAAGSDYKTLVRSARDANMNMLRVWGGGIYEDEEFYRACDENGILVWQDFMFACASYPEYDQFLKEVESEAVQNVARISSHPCLAIFCGNNESEWIWHSKTGNPVNEMPGASIFDKTLRSIVGKVAPEIPYWRSSPFGGEQPNSEHGGDHHQWEVWSAFKPPAEYAKNSARFVSEFGFQAPPSPYTIEKFTSDEDRDFQSPIMRAHNKQVEGTERLFRFLVGEVRPAKTFEDMVLQMQLVQAKAIKTGVANWRTRKWNTAGTIFWQLNDCWPVSSWSAIDYYKHPKAMYYWSKNFYKPIKIFLTEGGNRLLVHVVNDTLSTIDGILSTSVADIRGNVLQTDDRQIRVGKNSVTHLSLGKLPVERRNEVLCSSILKDGTSGEIIDEEAEIFASWLDFGFELPNIEISQTKRSDGVSIEVTSDRFVQGVYFPLNEAIGQLSDNFLTLLPGKRTIIDYRGEGLPGDIHPKLPLLAGYSPPS